MHLPQAWPHREHSQFLRAGGVNWHVQIMGQGPVLLLLHGTGASTHSWAGMAPHLMERFTLVIPDLPGQGFSSALAPAQTHIEGFGDAVSALLEQLSVQPTAILGHSAGAALAAHLCLSEQLNPSVIAAINGAFLPFGAGAAPLFSSLARWLSKSKLATHITAAHGLFQTPIRNMLTETGSEPTAAMLYGYQQLLSRPAHVQGTLAMMAGWNPESLKRRLPNLRQTLHLLVCENDRTVDPWQSERLFELVAHAVLHRIEGLGHLGHEERPALFARILTALLSPEIAEADATGRVRKDRN